MKKEESHSIDGKRVAEYIVEHLGRNTLDTSCLSYLNSTRFLDLLKLFHEGFQVPFILRYRKSVVGRASDGFIRKIYPLVEGYQKFRGKQEALKQQLSKQLNASDLGIRAVEKVTHLIDECSSSQELKDVESSVRKEWNIMSGKRCSKSEMARLKGFSVSAKRVLSFESDHHEIQGDDSTHFVENILPIASEELFLMKPCRNAMRSFCWDHASVSFMEHSDPKRGGERREIRVRQLHPHQISSLFRKKRKRVGSVRFDIHKERSLWIIANTAFETIQPRGIKTVPSPKSKRMPHRMWWRCIEDSYKRHFHPHCTRWLTKKLKSIAQSRNIEVFEENLQSLLVMRPIRDKHIMGVDPGFKNGVKIAIIDPNGNVVHYGTIYPLPPRSDVDHSVSWMEDALHKHPVNLIALGDGCGSVEMTRFIHTFLVQRDRKVPYTLVSEAGSSVYSTSSLAEEELGFLDCTIRSAVSIARRVQNSLSELCKMDPGTLGVGQYQHDLKKHEISARLEEVVRETVSLIGVEMNNASVSVLQHVPGLNVRKAKNIVDHRTIHGPFHHREELLNVKGIGVKTFEQCVGFLRIHHAPDEVEIPTLFDQTGIHPKEYDIASYILHLAEVDRFPKGIDRESHEISHMLERFNDTDLAHVAGHFGDVHDILSIEPILSELKQLFNRKDKESSNSRSSMFVDWTFHRPWEVGETNVIPSAVGWEDLHVGLKVTGTVRNITDFGCFVDIGCGKDGIIFKKRSNASYCANLFIGKRIECEVSHINEQLMNVELVFSGITRSPKKRDRMEKYQPSSAGKMRKKM